MYPLEERLLALKLMWKSPPSMTIFAMNLTYGAVATGALGLLFALASKVILKPIGNAANN